jgi:uncharacterized damage-inducible protein DinB
MCYIRRMRLTALLALILVTTGLSATTPAPPPKTGFRAEFLRDLDEVQKKIIDLAEAVPASKYEWRPAPGVRSISEVYMHIAGGNYFLASFAGTKAPSYDTSTLEKIHDKGRVVAELKKSFDHLRTAALQAKDQDLDKPIKMFGNDTTVRGGFLTALNHLHEHLGQSIAYARMNGVVPPWSGRE